MACYICGKNGHKRNKCPERISKIKCHECGNLGHYKNDCPSILEKIKNDLLLQENERRLKQENLLLQNKRDDEKWLNENVYITSNKLMNDSDIRNIIMNSYTSSFSLRTLTNDEIKIYLYKSEISCYTNNPLGRLLGKMQLDDFMSFISKWKIFLTISYDTTDDLYHMIYELNEANIIEKIETESNREYEYELCNKRVMRSRRHSTDWRRHIDLKYKFLILDEYSKYKDKIKYEDNINKFKGEIKFLYQ